MSTSNSEVAVSREKLPEFRPSIDRRFEITYYEDDPETPGKQKQCELVIYVIAGMYDDGRLGEVFFRGAKLGTLLSGTLDSMATMMSIALQYGVPLQEMTKKWRGCQFGPAQAFGLKDPEFRKCTSIFDLIAQWLDLRFPEGRLLVDPKAKPLLANTAP
jgi:ribonucleoside-diphosphate reductase alpha chain